MVGMVSHQATLQVHLLFVHPRSATLCFTYTPLTGIPLPTDPGED